MEIGENKNKNDRLSKDNQFNDKFKNTKGLAKLIEAFGTVLIAVALIRISNTSLKFKRYW